MLFPLVLLWLSPVASGSPGAPVFYRDILPVLANRCQSCHRPGEAAPMPLLTYEQTRPWAKAIREAVTSRRMPPWHADSTVRHYSNDLSLTDAERNKIIAWVNAGSPAGNPAQAPPPGKFTDGWRIDKPDLIITMPEPFTVPAKGVIDYQFITVPTGFTEDKWVEMAEVRPSAREVVHHAIVVMSGSDSYGEFVAGYAPGAAPQIWKPGVARLIPAGAVLTFQMHYTTNGKVTRDRTQIGFKFARQRPRQRVLSARAFNAWFTIPPNDPNYRVEASTVVPIPMQLAAVRPHMHYRGKSFEVKAYFPDGTTQVMLRVPKYDFRYQPYYFFETPVNLPAGTRLHCVAYFDNSPNNKANPGPNESVNWGEQSWEEMMIGWFEMLLPVDDAPRATGL